METTPQEAQLRLAMRRYQDGDPTAFDTLYALLAPALSRYLAYLGGPQLAEDLLQETFLQLHRTRRTYDGTRPVRPWAFAITRNVWLMARRSRRRRPDACLVLDEDVETRLAGSVGLRPMDELRDALRRLRPSWAEPLLLHHLWGFSYEEIAGMLGIGTGAARVRAHRGLTALRQLLVDGKRGSHASS